MSGSRFRSINQWYYAGFEDASDENDAADNIIRQPDRYLLNQEQLFSANGGLQTVAMSLGLASTGVMLAFATSRRMGSHFRNGQCTFRDWATILSGGVGFYCAGQFVGRRTFGDVNAWHNHWMAYTFVKAQNRYEGRRILTNTPSY